MIQDLFQFVLPSSHIITDINDKIPFLTEWRNRFTGQSVCILLPETTQQVSNIVKICCEHDINIIPQGGNTGLVGGQIPDMQENNIIISMNKMNKIVDISPENHAVTVESGVILQNLHDILNDKTDLIFPLTLASQGSAQIGGLISTNAGGVSVLKYGTMKDLIFGLEVVLPNGDILNDIHYLKKYNRGLDISTLFYGTEGIHGLITKASLKLFQKPKIQITFMVSAQTINHIMDCFYVLKNQFSDMVSMCELIPKIGFEFVFQHKSDIQNPFDSIPEWAALIEISSPFDEYMIMPMVESLLQDLLNKHIITDGVIAQNKNQSNHLHNIRLLMSESQKPQGASIKHDICVPVSKIPQLIDCVNDAVKNVMPDIRPVPFGHIGDGNVHYNFSQPVYMTSSEFMAYEPRINDIVFDIVYQLEGSFSAEHGIGQLRRDALKKYTSDVHQSVRRGLKQWIDKDNILNPNKSII